MSQTVFANGIGYEGKVTLTLKSNNKVLKSKTYKNNGTVQLFKFLGYCLMGACEDAEAKRLLPTRLLLLENFSNSGSGDVTTADPQNVAARTDWQSFAQTPTIVTTNAQVKVTYNFEVPKAAITNTFNQIALYGAGMDISENLVDFSAYHYLTNPYGALENQNPKDWSATTVLLIDWELTISNKNTGNTGLGG